MRANTLQQTTVLFLLAIGMLPGEVSRAEEDDRSAVQIIRQGDRIEIGNRFLARTFLLEPHLVTCAVTNRLTGRRFTVEGNEFLLDLGKGRTVDSSQFRLEAVQPDAAAGKLTFLLKHLGSGISAKLTYELEPRQVYIRKRLWLESGSTYVHAVDVDRLLFADTPRPIVRPDCLNIAPVAPADHLERVPKPSIWDIGLGQPVFVADQVFLGLEHPAGHNGCDRDGTVFLRHFPGQAGSIECKPAVLGVAADRPHERVQDAFLQYIAGLRRRPVERWVEFFFDAHNFDEQARHIVDTARDVFASRGIKLDSATINGWAEPHQGIMEPPRECPEFLPLLTDYTRKQLGCGLGLHVYTAGCRSPLLRDWIAARFDMAYVEPGPAGCGAYCLADPRVESLLTANLGGYLREHGVAMHYYDWGMFACQAGNHRGHMPGYGTEAIADAFLRHLRAMRAERPKMFLCDTGWFSPWWLQWYDAVFFAGGDWNANLAGPPAYATMDFLGSWRDHVMKQRLETRPYFPATGYINHGAISHDWMRWQNRAPQPRQAFVDYVAMMFLVGPQIAEYILCLPELSEKNRDDLAAVHRWGIARDAWLLADTRPVGGDPMQGKAYGFAHVAVGNRGVIGLRNPTILPRNLKLVFDEKLGLWPSPGPLRVTTTYPYTRTEKQLVAYGESLEINLSPSELRVLEIGPPETLSRPVTLGCREQLLVAEPERTTIGLLGNDATTVQLVSPTAIKEVLLDGKPCPVARDARQATIELPAATADAPTVRISDYSLVDGQAELTMQLSTDVPKGVSSSLVLLASGSQSGVVKLEASVQCMGKDLEVEAPHLYLRDRAGGPSGKKHARADDWSLFRVAIPEGHSELKCIIRPAQPEPTDGAEVRPPVGPWRGRLSVFLDNQYELPETHHVEIRHAAITATPLPCLPTHWNAVHSSRDVVVETSVTVQPPRELCNLALAGDANSPRVEADSVYPSYTLAPIIDGLIPPRGSAGHAWASSDLPQDHCVTLIWPEKYRIGKVYICLGASRLAAARLSR